MSLTNVLIVGQGIAGTCLAFALLKRGISFRIMDDGHASAASLVSTAIVNPVTGRRYAKSWNIDELLPLTRTRYSEIGNTIAGSYIDDTEIFQIIPDDRVEEIWMLRSGDAEFADYLDPDIRALVHNGIRNLRYGRIKTVLELKISQLLNEAKAWFQKQGLYVSHSFEYKNLRVTSGKVEYGLDQYDHIVFCEGYRANRNSYFEWLEIYPMKGDYLIVNIPDLQLKDHLKSNISLIPLGEDQYWCGSTYDRYNEDPNPSKAAAEYLSDHLSEIVSLPFKVTYHGSGIRCTTRDRRPYVGTHPEHSQIHIVTGMGTKGASLAPYCAGVMAEHLVEGIEIPREVDILRHVRS